MFPSASETSETDPKKKIPSPQEVEKLLQQDMADRGGEDEIVVLGNGVTLGYAKTPADRTRLIKEYREGLK